MIPPNYDDDEEMEDEEEQEGQLGRGKASGGRRGAKGAITHVALAHVSLPLAVSNKLTVTALGKVVWLSRWFHDEKYIYPVRKRWDIRLDLFRERVCRYAPALGAHTPVQGACIAVYSIQSAAFSALRCPGRSSSLIYRSTNARPCYRATEEEMQASLSLFVRPDLQVGYRAVRLMASGASGGREVRHTLEVLADADGVRPVFRCALVFAKDICLPNSL